MKKITFRETQEYFQLQSGAIAGKFDEAIQAFSAKHKFNPTYMLAHATHDQKGTMTFSITLEYNSEHEPVYK